MQKKFAIPGARSRKTVPTTAFTFFGVNAGPDNKRRTGLPLTALPAQSEQKHSSVKAMGVSYEESPGARLISVAKQKRNRRNVSVLSASKRTQGLRPSRAVRIKYYCETAVVRLSSESLLRSKHSEGSAFELPDTAEVAQAERIYGKETILAFFRLQNRRVHRRNVRARTTDRSRPWSKVVAFQWTGRLQTSSLCKPTPEVSSAIAKARRHQKYASS